MIRGIGLADIEGIKKSIKAGWLWRAIDCSAACGTKHGGNSPIGVGPFGNPSHVLQLDGLAILDAAADELSLKTDLS